MLIIPRTIRGAERKTSTTSKAFKLENVDWGMVDKEKAEFIYQEAQTVKKGIAENLNVLNDKASRLLVVTVLMISAAGYFLFSHWDTSSLEMRIGIMLFLTHLLAACGSFLTAIWPRGIHNQGSAPNVYFSHDYYKRPFINILKGNIIGAAEDIKHNRAIENARSYWLKTGLICNRQFPRPYEYSEIPCTISARRTTAWKEKTSGHRDSRNGKKAV